MKDLIKFRKVKNLHCQNCYFYPESICQFRNHFGCTGSDAYQIVKEEPVKIQTEYEWKKERVKLLMKIGYGPENANEIHRLDSWLNDNKPTNYQTCTKENTNTGDEVRMMGASASFYDVEHIFRSGADKDGSFVLYNDKLKRIFTGCLLENYEIDLNNTEGK